MTGVQRILIGGGVVVLGLGVSLAMPSSSDAFNFPKGSVIQCPQIVPGGGSMSGGNIGGGFGGGFGGQLGGGFGGQLGGGFGGQLGGGFGGQLGGQFGGGFGGQF